MIYEPIDEVAVHIITAYEPAGCHTACRPAAVCGALDAHSTLRDAEWHARRKILWRGPPADGLELAESEMFEFDPIKSRSNRDKHGIDFVAAQALWDDANLLEIPAKTDDEPRSLIIGRIEKRHWSAIITHRGETIRIISVRRSRPEEVALYES